MVMSMVCSEEGKTSVQLWLTGYFMENKQVFCTDDVLEKICQSVDKLYLCELTIY